VFATHDQKAMLALWVSRWRFWLTGVAEGEGLTMFPPARGQKAAEPFLNVSNLVKRACAAVSDHRVPSFTISGAREAICNAAHEGWASGHVSLPGAQWSGSFPHIVEVQCLHGHEVHGKLYDATESLRIGSLYSLNSASIFGVNENRLSKAIFEDEKLKLIDLTQRSYADDVQTALAQPPVVKAKRGWVKGNKRTGRRGKKKAKKNNET
jgi:hypothetical protein